MNEGPVSSGGGQNTTLIIAIVGGVALLVCLCVGAIVAVFAAPMFFIATNTSGVIMTLPVMTTPTPVVALPTQALPTQAAQGAPPEVIDVPEMDGIHVEVGESHDPYNSDPPSSGPHYEEWVDAGLYDEVVEDEYLVHNLEHGYVIIWYDCSILSDQECHNLKQDIQEIIDLYDGYKVIGMPRAGMETPIAMTSWGHLARLTVFDDAFVIDYIDQYQNDAPEPSAP